MQSVITFDMLLFACQLEKFYQLYLHIMAAVWAVQDSTCRGLHITDHESECIIKYDMVIFTIRTRASGRLVWHAAVERRPIQQPRGIIKLTASSKEAIDKIMADIEPRTAEF